MIDKNCGYKDLSWEPTPTWVMPKQNNIIINNALVTVSDYIPYKLINFFQGSLVLNQNLHIMWVEVFIILFLSGLDSDWKGYGRIPLQKLLHKIFKKPLPPERIFAYNEMIDDFEGVLCI